MRRQNEVRFARDAQAVGTLHSKRSQLVDFAHENHGIDDDAVSDDVDGFGVKNSARNRVQNVLNAFKFKGVSGVGAALKARYDVVVPREDVHNFTFPFVAPLQAEEYVSTLHCSVLDLA